jgi:hypothetical protein
MKLLHRAPALAYDVVTISKVEIAPPNPTPGAPSAFWHVVIRQQDQPVHDTVFGPLRRYLTNGLAIMFYRVSFARYDANRSLDIVIDRMNGEEWTRGQC